MEPNSKEGAMSEVSPNEPCMNKKDFQKSAKTTMIFKPSKQEKS